MGPTDRDKENEISLREYVESLIKAHEKQTTQLFAAAKDALQEAQIQLNQYKAQSNEWRGTLNDLITKLMMRPEILAMFNAKDSAISDLRTYVDSKNHSIEARVAALELDRSRSVGEEEASQRGHESIKWTFEKILSIIAILVSFAVLLWHNK